MPGYLTVLSYITFLLLLVSVCSNVSTIYSDNSFRESMIDDFCMIITDILQEVWRKILCDFFSSITINLFIMPNKYDDLIMLQYYCSCMIVKISCSVI